MTIVVPSKLESASSASMTQSTGNRAARFPAFLNSLARRVGFWPAVWTVRHMAAHMWNPPG